MIKSTLKKVFSVASSKHHRQLLLVSILLLGSILSLVYFSFAHTTLGMIPEMSASPSTQVTAGTTVTISWNTAQYGDPSCSANNFNSNSGYTDVGSGTAVVNTTTKYVITCDNGTTPSITISVSSAPLASITSFSPSNSQPTYGTGTYLNWTTSNATSCTGNNFSTGSGSPTSGSVYVAPTTQTNYVLTCYNVNGASVNAYTTVSPVPTVSLSINPNPVLIGNSAGITWSSGGASSCTGTNFSTGGAVSGSTSVAPGSQTTYTLTCSSSYGTSASQSVTENTSSPYPLSAMCSVSPTSTQTNQSVTWSASASGGTYPYNYTWGGNYAIAGDTTQSVATSYSSAGTYSGNILVTDSGASSGSSSSVNYQWGQVCTGTSEGTIYSDVEDGGTEQNAQTQAEFMAKYAFSGGISGLPADFYANPQNYCVEGQVEQRCQTSQNPPYQCVAYPSYIVPYYIYDYLYHGTSVGTEPIRPSYDAVDDFGTGLYQPPSGPTSQQTVGSACTNSVTVTSPAAPTVTMSANPVSIVSGQQSTLTWTSANATSCSIDNNIGSVPTGTNQSTTVSPTTSTTYTITCTGSGGSATAQAGVTVSQPLPDLTASLTSAEMNLTATVGTPITLNATVANIGAGPTGAPFQTTFWTNTVQNESSGNQQYSEFTSGVPNGFPANYSETDGYQVPITRTFTSAGTYYYQVCANLDQNWNYTVTESNYNNNCSAWGTITVTYPPTGGTCTYSPSSTGTGMPVSWTASPTGGSGTYTYQWSGTNLSGTSQTDSTSYSTSGTYSGQVTITSAGTSATAMCTAPGGGGPPYVTIYSCTPSLSANPTTIQEGASTQFTWSQHSGCASSCTLSDGTTLPTTGSETAYPPTPSSGTTDIYSLQCGAYTSNQVPITILVPTASLTANPTLVGNGGTANLTYQCGNSTSGSISPAVNGTVSADGSPHTISTLPITSQTKYTLICSETSGGTTYSATASAIVNVPPTFQNF